MPTDRADTLYRRCRSIVYCSRPIVEISVGGDIGRIVVGIVAIGICGGKRSAGRNGRAVAIVLAAEVLLGPALVADSYGLVCVAVVVTHRLQAANIAGVVALSLCVVDRIAQAVDLVLDVGEVDGRCHNVDGLVGTLIGGEGA